MIVYRPLRALAAVERTAGAINIFAGKGKIFDTPVGLLRSEILLFGLEAIVARFYRAPSWLDGKECIVLDFSETSRDSAPR